MVNISLELMKVNPDRNIFSINVKLTPTFFTLQRFGPSPSPNEKFYFLVRLPFRTVYQYHTPPLHSLFTFRILQFQIMCLVITLFNCHIFEVALSLQTIRILEIFRTKQFCIFSFLKGTVSVISSDISCKKSMLYLQLH